MNTHTTIARNGMAEAIARLADVGTVNPEARIQFLVGATLALTVKLNSTAFAASASGGGIDALSIPTALDPSVVTGDLTAYRMFNKDGAQILSGTVTITGGGGDIELPAVTVVQGDTLQLTSLRYNAPP
jgi:hypothetical protein